MQNTTEPGGADAAGGALLVRAQSSIRSCDDCVFELNSALQGGAVALLENSEFCGCEQCVFELNSASQGGALYGAQSRLANF